MTQYARSDSNRRHSASKAPDFGVVAEEISLRDGAVTAIRRALEAAAAQDPRALLMSVEALGQALDVLVADSAVRSGEGVA